MEFYNVKPDIPLACSWSSCYQGVVKGTIVHGCFFHFDNSWVFLECQLLMGTSCETQYLSLYSEIPISCLTQVEEKEAELL